MRKIKECQKCGASQDKILVKRICKTEDYYVVKCYCSECGKYVIAEDTEEAIEKWNRTRKRTKHV